MVIVVIKSYFSALVLERGSGITVTINLCSVENKDWYDNALWVMTAPESSGRGLFVLLVLTGCPDEQGKVF